MEFQVPDIQRSFGISCRSGLKYNDHVTFHVESKVVVLVIT